MAEDLGLTGNKAVEDAAIAFVIELEELAGRRPRDTRHVNEPVDLISNGRLIEVKAFGGTARGHDLWLEVPQVDTARSNPDSFHLYLVENVRQGDPANFRLIDIHGEQLVALMDRARMRSYYTVPFSTGLYDSLVARDAVVDPVAD